MEILQPIRPEPIEIKPEASGIPQEFLDAGINFKNVQFLNHLELKDEMFNPRVMEKIDFIASKLEGLDSLMDLDMRLGDDGSMPRIDKIYSHLKLLEQAEKAKEKLDIINEQLQNNERR